MWKTIWNNSNNNNYNNIAHNDEQCHHREVKVKNKTKGGSCWLYSIIISMSLYILCGTQNIKCMRTVTTYTCGVNIVACVGITNYMCNVEDSVSQFLCLFSISLSSSVGHHITQSLSLCWYIDPGYFHDDPFSPFSFAWMSSYNSMAFMVRVK